MTVAVKLSTLNGFVGDVPREQAETFDTTAIMSSGGVYFLGGVSRREGSDRIDGPLQALLTNTEASSRMQVWCRVYRIAGPVHVPTRRPFSSLPERQEAQADPGERSEREPAPRPEPSSDPDAGVDMGQDAPELSDPEDRTGDSGASVGRAAGVRLVPSHDDVKAKFPHWSDTTIETYINTLAGVSGAVE